MKYWSAARTREGARAVWWVAGLLGMGLLPVVGQTAASGFTINRANRNAVVAGYQGYYLASENYAGLMAWTGDTATCTAGTVSTTFQNDTLRRINYYRAQVGMPTDISFNATYNPHCQKAALMMAKAGALNHNPDTTWACYTADGKLAAANSNLSLGSYGPGAVDGQMEDDGANNTTAGHRRWLLYSLEKSMAHGSVPADDGCMAATVIWVKTAPKTTGPVQGVAWPNDGYVPWNLVPNSGLQYPRWSYSYPGATFSGANVTMSQGGTNVPVAKEEVANGYGDHTLVWIPSGIPSTAPVSDLTYTVTITGITGAPFTSVSYNVTLIDPNAVNDPPVVSGSSSPPAGSPSSYSFTATNQSEGYQAVVYDSIPASWTEGAETSPAPKVLDDTSGYALLSSSYAATGSRSFHLATPSMSGEGDSFVIDRDLKPASNSKVQFKYRRLFMHVDTKLRVELSIDGGNSFTTLASISGTNPSGRSDNWDQSFVSYSTNIPSTYTNRAVRLRFRLEPTGLTFLGTDATNGVYIDDVAVISGAELTNPSSQNLTAGASQFNFTPATPGKTQIIVVRPKLGGQWLNFGPVLEVVAQSLPVPVITCSSTATGSQGTAFSYTITATHSPTSYGASGLPAGASIATATGVITGQIAPGTYSGITLSATNAGGTGTAPLTITVRTGYEQAAATLYPGLGLPDADDDHDGVGNLLEVAILGRNPLVADRFSPTNYSVTKVASTLVLKLKKSGVAGLDYQALASATLLAGTWSVTGITVIKNNATDLEVSCPISTGARYLVAAISQNATTTQ